MIYIIYISKKNLKCLNNFANFYTSKIRQLDLSFNYIDNKKLKWNEFKYLSNWIKNFATTTSCEFHLANIVKIFNILFILTKMLVSITICCIFSIKCYLNFEFAVLCNFTHNCIKISKNYSEIYKIIYLNLLPIRRVENLLTSWMIMSI